MSQPTATAVCPEFHVGNKLITIVSNLRLKVNKWIPLYRPVKKGKKAERTMRKDA